MQPNGASQATVPRQRREAAALRRNAARVAAALAAGFSGSHQWTFGVPWSGGDAPPTTLAPQAYLGMESWADLMDADDVAAEKAAGRGGVAPGSPRAGHC